MGGGCSSTFPQTRTPHPHASRPPCDGFRHHAGKNDWLRRDVTAEARRAQRRTSTQRTSLCSAPCSQLPGTHLHCRGPGPEWKQLTQQRTGPPALQSGPGGTAETQTSPNSLLLRRDPKSNIQFLSKARFTGELNTITLHSWQLRANPELQTRLLNPPRSCVRPAAGDFFSFPSSEDWNQDVDEGKITRKDSAQMRKLLNTFDSSLPTPVPRTPS